MGKETLIESSKVAVIGAGAAVGQRRRLAAVDRITGLIGAFVSVCARGGARVEFTAFDGVTVGVFAGVTAGAGVGDTDV